MKMRPLSGKIIADRLEQAIPNSVEQSDSQCVWVRPHLTLKAALFLRDDPTMNFEFLNSISAIDYVECFEIVYHLTSFRQQHVAILKARVIGREAPSMPSVYSVWRGSDLQEREIWDLMGIHFSGHPNMKRIMLWEGFEGHPLRKDFL
jgi:NADH:ubiquinone oxidoreductase subunit C